MSVGPARILIAEDQAIVAHDVALVLEEGGYEVAASCASGEAAVQRAYDLRPDLVVMDINLAGTIDGIQAAADIQRGCDVPIVFLTAHSEEAILLAALGAAPVTDIIVKPFHEPLLLAAIERALRRHTAEPSSGHLEVMGDGGRRQRAG